MENELAQINRRLNLTRQSHRWQRFCFLFFLLILRRHLYIFGNNHFGPGFDSKVEKKSFFLGPHYLEAYNRRATLTRKVEFDQIKCISLTIHHFTIVPLPNPRERFKSVQAPPRHHHSLQRLLQPFFQITSLLFHLSGQGGVIQSHRHSHESLNRAAFKTRTVSVALGGCAQNLKLSKVYHQQPPHLLCKEKLRFSKI